MYITYYTFISAGPPCGGPQAVRHAPLVSGPPVPVTGYWFIGSLLSGYLLLVYWVTGLLVYLVLE